MNTQSLNNAIIKATGLIKSAKTKDYTRYSGSGNIAYRLVSVIRWKGDFHCSKIMTNAYEVKFDNRLATEKKSEVIKVLESLGCEIKTNGTDFLYITTL